MEWIRRGLAVLLLLVLLTITALSAGGQRFQVCSSQPATTGEGQVVKVCRPLGLTDPVLLMGLLLVLAPLAPDIAKLQIGGLLTLERKLEETQRAQRELQAQLNTLAFTQTVRQEQHLHFDEPGATPHTRIEVAEDILRAKAAEFLEGKENEE